MTDERFFTQITRKIIVTGHYGSGKTEFAVSLALLLAAYESEKLAPRSKNGLQSSGITPSPVALIDLDIVNPYFRSREQRDMLGKAGVSIYGSAFDKESTAEMPALGASLRAPLENSLYRVIVDVGGNDSGALVLNQFGKYFSDNETTVLAIVNANRPETNNLDGALRHIAAIESATGLTVSGVVNNCHLLRETKAETIIKGHVLCKSICEETGKLYWCDCYPEGIVSVDELSGLSGNLMPLGLYMRQTWLDI